MVHKRYSSEPRKEDLKRIKKNDHIIKTDETFPQLVQRMRKNAATDGRKAAAGSSRQQHAGGLRWRTVGLART